MTRAARAIRALVAATIVVGTLASSEVAARGVAASRTLTFPRDDGAHEAYRREWWRAFGFLTTPDGRAIDASATFFRFATRADPQRANASAWSRPEFYAATFTLADRPRFRYESRSRIERAGVGLARAASDRLDVRAGTWTLRANAQSSWRRRRFTLSAARAGDALALELVPQRAPIALGDGGIERVGRCATCRAYGYAYTRLRARGHVTIAGVKYAVVGSMWLDHEFGDDMLGPDDDGMVRVAVQFEDGRDVLATCVHGRDGVPQPIAATLVRANGAIARFGPDDFRLSNFGGFHWTSPRTATAYPSLFELTIPSEGLAVGVQPGPREAEIVAQRGQPSYFEGGADVGRIDPPDADHGRAFVELTGYDRKLPL